MKDQTPKYIPKKVSVTHDIDFDRHFEEEKVLGKIVQDFLLNVLPRDYGQGSGGI